MSYQERWERWETRNGNAKIFRGKEAGQAVGLSRIYIEPPQLDKNCRCRQCGQEADWQGMWDDDNGERPCSCDGCLEEVIRACYPKTAANMRAEDKRWKKEYHEAMLAAKKPLSEQNPPMGYSEATWSHRCDFMDCSEKGAYKFAHAGCWFFACEEHLEVCQRQKMRDWFSTRD